MASLRHIRGRLRSTQNTKQIMRAMQLVSASKLKRAQARLLQARSTLGFLDGLLQRVLATAGSPERSRGTAAPGLDHPLCASQTAAPSTLVLLTSDTGLCGSYNANLIQLAESYLKRDSAKATQAIYIGKRGHRYFTKRGFAAAEAYLDLAGRPDLKKAEAIGRALMERFLSGRTGAIQLLYSQFVSAMSYRPTLLQWLPIQLETATGPEAGGRRPNAPGLRPSAIGHRREVSEYIFEPSPKRVFEDLLPRWALATFQLVMLEAFTSEHSARMIAMKNATDNAEELLTSLTTQRNKIRQAAITKELSEIVGTAEALR
jgi:F-type H+-transporting ATPase subunit gamma